MSQDLSTTNAEGLHATPLMSPSDLPAIKACLFDLDGLLIDSEDKFAICTNEILRQYGRPNLLWHIRARLQGLPGPSAGKVFQDWAQLPISKEEWLAKAADGQKRRFAECVLLPGVENLLRTLSKSAEPAIHVGLATGSSSKNFILKTSHLARTFDCFQPEHRILGDNPRLSAGCGKPCPDIYLFAFSATNDSLVKTEARADKAGRVPGV